MSAAPKEETKAAPAKDGAAPPAASGGLMAWLPLGLNILLMPALAFAMTKFVLLPRMMPSTEVAHAEEADAHGEADPHKPADSHKAADSHKGAAESKESETSHKDPKSKGKSKFSAPLSSKILVNVSGTLGARYLLANLILVSSNKDLKSIVEEHDEQLRDAAAGALSSKTIVDLEKPGARNLIRTEMIGLFNTILGKGVVQEIYLTEFAIQ